MMDEITVVEYVKKELGIGIPGLQAKEVRCGVMREGMACWGIIFDGLYVHLHEGYPNEEDKAILPPDAPRIRFRTVESKSPHPIFVGPVETYPL